MSDATLQINSQEEVAYKLFELLREGSEDKKEALKLYAQCLQVVKGIPVDRVLA